MPAPIDPVFERIVAIGDSVSQGCFNVGVSTRSQPWGLPAILARQVGAELPLPLLAEPGYPPHIDRMGAVLASRTTDRSLLEGRRVEPHVEPYNLAVAGARLCDVMALSGANLARLGRTVAVRRLTRLVLNPTARPDREPDSQLDRCIALDPTLVLCWVGGNDLMEAVFYPHFGVTPVSTFERLFQRLVSRLLAETRAVVVIPGIPDITSLPLLHAFRRRRVFLARAQAVLEHYDAIIAAAARRSERVVHIDPRPAMREYNRVGLDVRGWRLPYRVRSGRLTFAPLRGYGRWIWSGGLVSYDGLHPTQVGYALMAKHILEPLGERLGVPIPPVDLEQVARHDDLLAAANPVSAALTELALRLIYEPGVRELERRPWPNTPGRGWIG
ncbi:MAG: hypothetical protein HYU66_17770 [Armatimonadetes bacterium]|nr:hypothetical protein [Armatimonadota bacterium]